MMPYDPDHGSLRAFDGNGHLTGKTFVAIAAMGYGFLHGAIAKVLIVCPSSVISVWPKEFTAFADFPYDVKVLDGPVAKRARELDSWPENRENLQAAVTNYEGVWRMMNSVIAWKPDFILCDEAHRIKTPGARQSKALHRLAGIAGYRMILTGTPVTQGPLDFWSMYHFLSPGYFGNSFYSFRNRYANMVEIGGPNGRFKKVVSYKNLDELAAKAHAIAYRITKAEALDLPEQVDVIRECTLESAAAKVYRDMVRESVAELESATIVTAANVLARLLRLSQITGGFVGGDDARLHQVSKAKLELLEDVLEDLIAAGKKVVIFARFTPEMRAIEDLLIKREIGYARIAGDVDMKTRGGEVMRFQEDAGCMVFLAQIQTAGLGITLTAADTAIYYSLSYSLADYDQSRSRIHRLGQKNACTYIHLVAKDTVDEQVIRALAGKRDIAAAVVDNWRALLR